MTPIKRVKQALGFPNMTLLSRALSNHDPVTAYTLLAEWYLPQVAGRMLVELIKTVPDWPYVDEWEDIQYKQKLTHRELQVLRCAEVGMSAQETAKELILGEETIKTYKGRILVKLGAKTIGEAVHLAHELGLIE